MNSLRVVVYDVFSSIGVSRGFFNLELAIEWGMTPEDVTIRDYIKAIWDSYEANGKNPTLIKYWLKDQEQEKYSYAGLD